MGKHIPLIPAALTLAAITACSGTSSGGRQATPSPGHAQAATRVKNAVDGSILTIKTKLYPKSENKDAAQEIGLFVVAAVECGADVGAKYTSIDVVASNGDPLLSSFRPPVCQ